MYTIKFIYAGDDPPDKVYTQSGSYLRAIATYLLKKVGATLSSSFVYYDDLQLSNILQFENLRTRIAENLHTRS
jgi:hypothetical protein